MRANHSLFRFRWVIFGVVCLLAIPANTAARQPDKTDPPRQPQVTTSYLSIPPAAFHPMYYDTEYENSGGILQNNDSDGGIYYAAVYLPNGVTVTRVTFYYWDNSPGNGYLHLTRVYHLSGYGGYIASLPSSNATNSVSTINITYPLIENASYMYFLRFEAPSTSNPETENVFLYGALLEYTIPLDNPATDYRSIPAAGFVPYNGGYWYINSGDRLDYETASGEGTGDYQAPVFLPDGATVSGATFYYYDELTETDKDGEAQLHSANLGDVWPDLQDFKTSNVGFGSDDRTFSATIDNVNNGYWVFFRLPSSFEQVMGRSLVIRYSYPTSHSFGEVTTVLPAAFMPRWDGQDYENHGRFLINHSSVYNQYIAPLYLDHGERLLKVQVYYYSPGSTSSGTYSLQTSGSDGNISTLLSLSSGGVGWNTSYVDLSDGPVYYVDNQHKTYWLKLMLPADGYIACGVVLKTSERLLFLPTVSK